MSRPQIEYTPDGFSRGKDEPPEVSVVGHDDTPVSQRSPHQFQIAAADEPVPLHVQDVMSLLLQIANDLWMDVFIGEELRLVQPHASTSVVMTTSFSRNRAA